MLRGKVIALNSYIRKEKKDLKLIILVSTSLEARKRRAIVKLKTSMLQPFKTHLLVLGIFLWFDLVLFVVVYKFLGFHM